jgi:two-component system OmpR family response regulator
MDMDVRILRWPEQADEADRLARLEVPRLLIVESGVAPPTETSCVVDWLRLPADDEDLRARMAALAERAARHPSRPVVNEYGQLSHRGTTAFLSRIDEQITNLLAENFGHPVPAEELISRVWTDDGTNETLRVHISRLRHRIAPLDLTITNIKGHGYAMREADTKSTTHASLAKDNDKGEVCGSTAGAPGSPSTPGAPGAPSTRRRRR